MREARAKKAALYGVLIALAMVMSYIETLLPLPLPVPGVKLGLANLVTVAGLYLIGVPGTAAVTLLRIILVGLSFGNPFSMLYGLAGSLLSLCCMALARRFSRLPATAVSVLGGIAHNVGQLTFAAFVVRTPGLFFYLPYLLAAGCAAGFVIGLLGGMAVVRLERYVSG